MLRRTISLPCVRSIYTTSLRRAKVNLNVAPKEHSCGIPNYKPPSPPPISVGMTELPAMLIRPPCLPGGKHGDVQTCIKGQEGFYCPPCRLKFKYPPFSENIDFMPNSIQPPCWWKLPPTCELDEDAGTLMSITKRWECAYD